MFIDFDHKTIYFNHAINYDDAIKILKTIVSDYLLWRIDSNAWMASHN